MQKTANVIIFVANRGYALTSSRLEILQHFIALGWKVVIATSRDSESKKLIKMGATFEQIKFHRGGFSIINDVFTYIKLLRIYQKWEPKCVHHFHAKPVILGSIAAKKALGNSVKVINTITGLGHAFIQKGLVRFISGFGYRIALRHSLMNIFQNSDDLSLFIKKEWVTKKNSKLIIGSGVELNKFTFVNRVDRKNSIAVVMLGRLIKQKGTEEFVKVAKNIKQVFPNVSFFWAGESDFEHPDAVKRSTIENYKEIKYLGKLSNVRELFKKSDILLFPSYREGVPRVVLEGSATGLPTVAFDVPGVREAIINNKTGYLVQDKNINGLTKKLSYLIKNKNVRLRMGREARIFMENNFDKKDIIKLYIKNYMELGCY